MKTKITSICNIIQALLAIKIIKCDDKISNPIDGCKIENIGRTVDV